MGESPQISNLQTESKYLDLFKFYCVFTDLRGYAAWWVGGWVVGAESGLGQPIDGVISTNHNFLNRIQLS